VPPSAGRYDQEFLYHLYRGSELLQDNAVDEAKAEFERAIKLQPRDVEGQGLLGVVYFRLGMYPRAIEIYQQLQIAARTEVAPKINLALCYLKTGQTELARDQLEQAVAQAPDHKRAWGYLGLVFQRFGDFEKATVAFERADRPKLAQRMAALASEAHDARTSEIPELGHSFPAGGYSGGSQPPPSFRPSLMPNMGRVEAPPAARIGTTNSPPLAAEANPPTVRPPAPTAATPSVTVATAAHRLAREAELIFPESPRIVLHSAGWVLARIDGSLALRPSWVTTLCHDGAPFATRTLRRNSRGTPQHAPLGGESSPLVALIGSGRAVLAPRPGSKLFLAEVNSDPLNVLESYLVAFEPQVEYETAPLDPLREDSPIAARLTGRGVVVLYCRFQATSIEVKNDRPMFARAETVLGWLGSVQSRLVPSVEAPAGLSSMISFSGQGFVLLDLPTEASL
jgi:hypothetical protein